MQRNKALLVIGHTHRDEGPGPSSRAKLVPRVRILFHRFSITFLHRAAGKDMVIRSHTMRKGRIIMNYDATSRTFDCEPTLTDSQVLEFCINGCILLEGVVPDDVNQRACDYLDGKIPANPGHIPEGLDEKKLERIRNSHEPSSIFLEQWYLEHVLLNPKLCGVMRSLLGKNVGLPVLASAHTSEGPKEAQGWHHDGDCIFGPEFEFIEVFYFPQDTPAELGPTEIAPGTHFKTHSSERDVEGVLLTGPAGTIGIHHQSILHRRGAATATGVRRMLKYIYWRTVPPARDWIVEPDFDFRTAYYGGNARYAAHMFYWLCGRADEYRIIGGQAWPWRTENQIGPSWGFGRTKGYLPDWRDGNRDGYSG